jgi:single-stranded-DNA-specific exonuclease
MNQTYLWHRKKVPDKEKVIILARELNIHPSLSEILIHREIDDLEKARSFFRPKLEDLHDPFLMKDMDKAVTRIEKSLEEKENILIYGDYDVDGTTAVSILYLYLQESANDLNYYVPDRYSEGYGISKEGIDFAKELDSKLIIALDCGVRANEVIDYAVSLDIDVIVCDHHIPGDTLPKAFAMLNPKQEGCEYPFKELSGCGIGFKLIQALEQSKGSSTERHKEYLDLVMVSIAADIVSMRGENRILTYFGLEKIKKDPNLGLKALLEVAGLHEKSDLSVSNVVFGIAPRINAAGRMKHGLGAVEVLIADNYEQALEKSFRVNEQNVERRSLDTKTTEEALDATKEMDSSDSFCTVLFNEDWHQGILGIVASRCIEHYYRPTIILAKKGNIAVGSARSIKDFNLFEGLNECSDLLLQWGGHAFAAGLSIEVEKIPELRKRLNGIVKNKFNGNLPGQTLEIDSEITFQDVNKGFFSILKQMEPHGPGNMRPVFSSRGIKKTMDARILKEKHLKGKFYQEDKVNSFEAIGFNKAHLEDLIKGEAPFDMVFSVFENNFRGDSKLELEIRDLRESKNGT